MQQKRHIDNVFNTHIQCLIEKIKNVMWEYDENTLKIVLPIEEKDFIEGISDIKIKFCNDVYRDFIRFMFTDTLGKQIEVFINRHFYSQKTLIEILEKNITEGETRFYVFPETVIEDGIECSEEMWEVAKGTKQ